MRCVRLRGLRLCGASRLDVAHKGDGPDVWSRTSQYRARKARCSVQGEWGRLVERCTLEMDRGSDDEVAVQSPIAMLHMLASSSTYVSDLLEMAYDRRPCSRSRPWSIVFYSSACVGGPTTRVGSELRSLDAHTSRVPTYALRCTGTARRPASAERLADQDGVNPSDAISKHHSRKSAVFYWSIMEVLQLRCIRLAPPFDVRRAPIAIWLRDPIADQPPLSKCLGRAG